jgi:ribose/xylose/arabinose/galactoside ABC-type transport system permease subunit
MRHRREISVALTIVALALVLAIGTPGFFARDNLIDLFLANMPVLIVALGMTLVILTANIDISVGSMFAVCGVAGGLLAKAGVPLPLVAIAVCATGAALGGINGALVAFTRIPAIVVTLATMVAFRDGLRWATEGAWIENLPERFQWLGLGQAAYPLVAAGIALGLQAGFAWGMHNLAAGRAIYATGSHTEGARLAGLHTGRVTFSVFGLCGGLTGLAAVVVGGTSITGGRGTVMGTLLGVILLGAIGPALTFLGVSAYWERAIQGGIILAAVAFDALRVRPMSHAAAVATSA